MTFQEYAKAVAKKTFTQKEIRAIEDFGKGWYDVSSGLARKNKDEARRGFDEIVSAIGFMSNPVENFESEQSHKAWELDFEKLEGLHDLLLEGDNFKDLMAAGTAGDNPMFGKDGKKLFEMMGILRDRFGVNIDPAEWKKHYDDMQKGLDWKKDVKRHREVKPEEVNLGEQEVKPEEGPKPDEKAEPKPEVINEPEKKAQNEPEKKAQNGPEQKEQNEPEQKAQNEPEQKAQNEPEEVQEDRQKGILDKYTHYDLMQGQAFGGSIIFGLLGKVLNEDQQRDLYKKISFFFAVWSEPGEASRCYSGMGYGDACRFHYDEINSDLSETEFTRKEEAVQNIRLLSHAYKHYKDPAFEKPVKDFIEGMEEIAAHMDEYAKTAKFDTPAQEDYFNLMRGFTQDVIDGTFTQKMKDNPLYLYSYNMTAKLANTAPNVDIREENDFKFDYKIQIPKDDYNAMNILQDTGMIQAMAGARKMAEMEAEHLKTGDVSRDDLIAEYKDQMKRMEKALSIKEEHFNKLKKLKLFDNDWEEVTFGKRGYKYALEETKFREQLLRAGYPIEDMSAMSGFAYQVILEEDALKELADKLKNEPVPQTEQEKAGRTAREEQYKLREANVAKLRDVWENAVKSRGVTEEERLQHIRNIRNAMSEFAKVPAENREMNNDTGRFIISRLDERQNAAIGVYDKAMLSQSSTELYNMVDMVDPALMSSSKQFSEFKKNLKELARMQRELDPKDPEARKAYTEQLEETAFSASMYLRYKTKQMNEPGGKHKRSKAEAKRVRMVESALTSLNNQRFPGEKDPINVDRDIATIHVPTGDAVTKRIPDPQYLTPGYDNYILLHTGRAAVNAPFSEMKDTFAKIMAARMLESSGKEFDVGSIHKCAERVKKIVNLDEIEGDEIRSALANPKNAARQIKQTMLDNYGVSIHQDSLDGVKKYVDSMIDLYKRLPEPEKDGSYKKLFELVEKAAHLPANKELPV